MRTSSELYVTAVSLLSHIDVRDYVFPIDPRQITNVCELIAIQRQELRHLGPHLEPLQGC
jgi:hypothetical protein